MRVSAAGGFTAMAAPQQGTLGLANQVKLAESDFEELFLQHYARIVSVLVRLVGDRPRAEELASDVFLKLYRQPLTPRPDGNPAGWLYRTATNVGIDALRASARRQHYEQAAARGRESEPASSLLDQVIQAEERERVRAALARLKPPQAQILVLRSSGFSYNELAESLGVQRGSVGTMLARAEEAFRKCYREMFSDEQEDL